MTTPDPHSHDTQLDALVARYIEAIERSETPDREKLIADNPALANGLRRFFTDYDRLQLTNLQPAAHQVNPDATFIPQHEPQPGTIFGGRYKLLQNIGEGGMGSVWVAEQKEPVKRKVAIKLVKAGMDSKQVLARFEAERQALAMMDHPNIAKVFDGGISEHGRPYFVMEYVRGVPFTEYCDKARLSLKERLNLFIPVCQAVQHAHHKGIVHRDLKPSNILICLYDGKPVPKVIDFGLAKAMHQQLTEQSIFTAHGVMVGTPLYMSPEQAEHNNLDVDTRTDIYSLGVVLYELLTGTTPLEREQLRTAAYNEVLRLIKEVEPPRPSTRLSGSDSLPSIAAQRSIDPRHLQKSVAGDLDWIVMKALEKERSRRYETANGFIRDIERFLSDEAVEACPPSRSYRLKRFVRKHKGQVIAASGVLLTLVFGLAATTWQWRQARQAERAATLSEGEAIASEQKAIQARDQATKDRDAKNAALTAEAAQRILADKQRDLAERQLIEGLLRPIGYGDEPNTAELRSFVDWSAIPDARLKLRIMEVAFENPEMALRVARRAERAIQSSVGLSQTRRARAIELMSAKQRDMNSDPRIRVAAVWLALELDSTDSPALPEALTWLSQPNSDSAEPRPEFTELVDFITTRIENLSQEQITQGGKALIDILEKTPDRDALQVAANGLVTFAPRLGPEQITRGGDALIGVLETTQDSDALRAAGNGLVALAPKLSPEQITHGWDALIGVLEKSKSGVALKAAVNGLVALAPKLNPDQTAHGWDTLIGVFEKTMDNYTLQTAGNLLVALAPKLSPDQFTHGWDAIIGVLGKSTNGAALDAAGNVLVALAPKLSPEQITRGWEAIIGVLEKPTDSDTLHVAGNCLVALAPKLSPEQISRGWDVLFGVLEKTEDWAAQQAVRNGLVALAAKLSPEQITRSGEALIGVLEKSEDWASLAAAKHGLVALAPKLSPEQLTRGGDAIIGVLEKSEGDAALQAAGNGLMALVPNLSPEQITRGGDAVIGVLEKTTDADALYAAANGLVTIAPKLSPEQIARGWDALIGVLEKTDRTDPWGLAMPAAGNGLVALAPKLSPEQITHGGDALIGVLKKTTDYHALEAAGNGLVALAAKLTPEQITRSGDALIGVLEKTTDSDAMEKITASYDLRAAGNGLVALAPKLSPEQITRGCDAIIGVLEKTTDSQVSNAAGNCLVALAPQLNPEQITRVWDALIGVLEKTADSDALQAAGNGLLALAPKLRPDTRVRTAEMFVASLHRLEGFEIIQPLLEMMPLLERPTQDRISNEAMTILLDYLAESEDYFGHSSGMGEFAQGVIAIRNEQSLASLLQHPASTGEPREFMLQRFEELVFHDGKHVLLPLPEPLGERQGNDENPPSAIPAADGDKHEGLTPNRSPSEPPPRRFHNLHDAAAWIQQNWPDFDLEATHSVTWRGEM